MRIAPRTTKYHSGIRGSIGKGTVAQLWAIATSPFHLGAAGLAAAGGVDPYYVKRFTQLGYTLPGGGGASSVPPPAAPAPSGGSTVSGPTLATFLGMAGSTVLTSALVLTAAAKYAKINGGSYGPAYQGASNSIQSALQPWIGTELGSVPFNVDASGHNTGALVVPAPGQSPNTPRGSLVPDIGSAIAGLPAALGGVLGSLLVNGAVLVVVLVLAYKGLEILVEPA